MKEYKLHLIGAPDFFNIIDVDNIFIDFNSLFWEYIFLSNKSKEIINFSELSNKEKLNLAFLLANLKLAYNIFLTYRYKKTCVSTLIFAFNIINGYLKLTRGFNGGINIRFYNYFRVDNNVYDDLEHNIIYKFYINECLEKLIKIENNSVLNIELFSSDQLLQIAILNNIFTKILNKKVILNINIDGLAWFENKKIVEKRLTNKFNNIIFRNDIVENNYKIKKINNLLYYKTTLIDNFCSWNKCSFCNIGKNKENKLDKNNMIDNFIIFIKKHKIKFLQLSDPSISLDDIIMLSRKILKNNISINIKIFARYSEGYTDNVLELLGRAGVKFLGIGLESTSTRLNNLMKKYDKDYGEEDFEEMAIKCDKHGILLHYYTIFGFPTETKEEIIDTKKFLIKMLKKYTFFSYTAGLFGVNVGTDVYLNKDKYLVSFKEDNIGGETFIENYFEKKYFENKDFLKNTINELKQKLFFGDISIGVDINSLWYFLEKSNIFHMQKLLFDTNPYLDFFMKNKDITLENFVSYKYKLNKYLQFTEMEDNNIIVKNWLLGTKITIDKSVYNLLKEYRVSYIMDKNINLFLSKREFIINDKLIYELIKGYFFIKL